MLALKMFSILMLATVHSRTAPKWTHMEHAGLCTLNFAHGHILHRKSSGFDSLGSPVGNSEGHVDGRAQTRVSLDYI